MNVGGNLAKAFFEYMIMKEEEERQQLEKRKHKKKALTPSGSSEALDEILASDSKLTNIRKKLVYAQNGSS
jgi:hypothetical protein